MKLISPQTLAASLLGIVIIIIKIVSFDEIQDLFWIVLFSCLVIRALKVSFSQEAYDDDVKSAYRGKVLYGELFGRFAYIAIDIPLIMIIASGVLALVCPVTPLLRILLCMLLVFTAGYAIWISWYISKQKQMREGTAEWETVSLTAEEERAWKYSDICHDVAYGIIGVLIVLYLIFGDPRIYMNNEKLEDALTTIEGDRVVLEDVVPFEWTTLYTFDPYTSLERIEWITGSNSPALQEGVSEGMTHFVFMNKGQIMPSVCAYPSSIGYSLSFSGGDNTYYDYMDGGYSHIEYGDRVTFEITRTDGIIRLYTFIKESIKK